MKYRKKPIEIEAICWRGDNLEEMAKFMGYTPHVGKDDNLCIQTLEGMHFARKGSFVIRGIQGEFYPCQADIFKETYIPIFN